MRSRRIVIGLIGFAALLASWPVRAQRCPSGESLCGASYCAPTGNVCCDSVGHPEKSCPPSLACVADGTCTTVCTGGAASTIASCGGDSCGCSAPCKHHSDCESTCCTTAGYCAPLCVCEGGKLFVGCDGTKPGVGGLPEAKGCQAAPGSAAAAPSLIALVLCAGALALLRRRRV